jgi:hypothetical protein
MAAVAHRATVHWQPLLGKARRADIVIFYKCSELGKNHDTVGPLGLKKSWGLCHRGTSSPGIHCVGPLGLKTPCRPAGPEDPLSARWA